MNPQSFSAFSNSQQVSNGGIQEVALAAWEWTQQDTICPMLIIDDDTGAVVDLDFRGEPTDVLAQLSAHPKIQWPTTQEKKEETAPLPTKRGRPKLGVVCREVSLLPKHWDWLKSQPSSASATLRKLIEERMKTGAEADRVRRQTNAAYSVMSLLAGDFTDFENASRALFAHDLEALKTCMTLWPPDVRGYVEKIYTADK